MLALDRDPDRGGHVEPLQRVARPALDRGAGADVHGVDDAAAHQLGVVGLDDGAEHRGLLAHVERAAGQALHRCHQVRVAADARQRFLDALEAADRGVELLAHRRVRADLARGHLRRAHRQRRQRDRTPRREALHQHAPAVAGAGEAADDGIERHEGVFRHDRAVVEGHAHRVVALADIQPRRRARDQRAGDAEIAVLLVRGAVAPAGVELVGEQAMRIAQAEGHADHGRDRRQGDVALLRVEADAERVLALVQRAYDHGLGLRGGRVGTGLGSGQREAGDVLAARQARQVMVLLRVGAVMQEQFGRAQRVGHHHGDGAGHAARGDLRHHPGVADVRELEPAIGFGDDHAEEAVLLEEGPDLRRQVALLDHVPVVEPAAQFLDRAVDEGLLLGADRRDLERQQLVPVGAAGEQVGVPPHRAGLERDALGIAQLGQDLGHAPHRGARNQRAPQRRQAEHQRQRGEHGEDAGEQRRRRHAVQAPAHHHDGRGREPGQEPAPQEHQGQQHDERKHDGEQHGVSSGVRRAGLCARGIRRRAWWQGPGSRKRWGSVPAAIRVSAQTFSGTRRHADCDSPGRAPVECAGARALRL